MTKPIFLIDGHEDIAHNFLKNGRDYSLRLAQVREHDEELVKASKVEETLLGWDAYQEGGVGIIFTTLFAGPSKDQTFSVQANEYSNIAEAHQLYRRQVDFYHSFTANHPEQFSLITTRPQFSNFLNNRNISSKNQERPIGLVMLMEGAEGIQEPDELDLWWELGVRIIGPAWKNNQYCGGTGHPGPLTPAGIDLLRKMDSLNFALDLSHLDEQSALQALDIYTGVILASHANPKALLPEQKTNRHLTREVLEGILEHDGVIGLVPYNLFISQEWHLNDDKMGVRLEDYVNHIDYICQKAGSSRHAAIGTDFDGGLGVPSVPAEVQSIADLQQIVPILSDRGYTKKDIDNIFNQNWLRMLQEVLPD
ncbi:MAG: membrane dipeptidase [Anaerolineales bacterium]|nr:membrane dipeptidase [Anaerolineales bacterium]